MSKVSGAAFILAGLAVAAYALPAPSPAVVEKSVATGTNPGGQPAGRSDTLRTGIVIPSAAPLLGKMPEAPSVVRRTASSAAEPARQSRTPASGRKKKTVTHVVVTDRAPRTPVGQSAPSGTVPLGRSALTRELQRQLQRVGCYGGNISGVWTPSTQRAMKQFNERVNATLPVDQPDTILLAMLQSHADKVCGPGCPAGQSRAEQGRCVPSALVAGASKKHAPSGDRPTAGISKFVPAAGKADPWSPAVAAPSIDAPPAAAGRMGLAGPKVEGEGRLTAPKTAAQHENVRRRTKDQTRSRHASRSRHAPARRGQVGAWIFFDAPVDRMLAR